MRVHTQWSPQQWAVYDRMKWDETARLDGLRHRQLRLTDDERAALARQLLK